MTSKDLKELRDRIGKQRKKSIDMEAQIIKLKDKLSILEAEQNKSIHTLEVLEERYQLQLVGKE